MRWALAALALLAGTLAAGPAIALPEGTQRVWRVRWIDPNPGYPSERELVIYRGLFASPEPVLWPSVQSRADGAELGVGWLAGAPTGAAPEVRGRLIGGAAPPSASSASLVLERSVVMAAPVPEPGVGAGLLAGIVGLLLWRR